MKFATFNLYQFLKPPFYWYEKEKRNTYSQKDWDNKKSWIRDQLRILDADVVGLQEVFSVDELEELVTEMGYDYYYTVETPLKDAADDQIYVKPVVAIASRYALRDVQSVQVPSEIRSDLPLKENFNFSRMPIRAYVHTESDLGDVLVYVAHLKSKRPVIDDIEYEAEQPWVFRTVDTMQRLSRGHIAALLQRGAEATILYHDITKALHYDNQQPVVVMGDLNDKEDSIPLNSLMMQNRVYEIGGVKSKEWPRGVKADLFDYRLGDTFSLATDTLDIVRPYTHIYRGEGGTLDYILTSNALNIKNPHHVGYVHSFKVLNTHLKSDGIGNHKQSDHGQIVVEVLPKFEKVVEEPVIIIEPEVIITDSMTRQEFIELAGGVYQNHESYRGWKSHDKWENFWEFFFDNNYGWVKSVYGAIPIDELYQKRRHSIEHIIPKSFLKDYLKQKGVPHNVRNGATVNPLNFVAAERGLNSKRSNFPFDMDDDEIKRPFKIDLNPSAYMTTGYDGQSEWIIPSRTRGDIARSILYMVMTYEIDELYNRHLETLVHWAKIDPATSWELAFNDWVYEKLGIRNPFIAPIEEANKLLNDTKLLKSVLIEGR